MHDADVKYSIANRVFIHHWPLKISCEFRARESCRSKGLSARDSCADAFHDLQNIIERRHRRVARSRHRKRAVGRAAIDGKLRILAREKSVNQSRREGVSAADAV